ncbi:DNA-DIRECTED RNA polymerase MITOCHONDRIAL [Salix purpurea]|uniref:DNA-DIRECTED RNA polymerase MITOCHONDRIAL n=1 Tax=Salix purpurea TaxID=77065 RepID=A0A9Q0ZHS5_SALPP|nr:DNA-DIRECTED RNA polymerase MITOCHONDRIAL [Salix purpurea]
MWRNVAKQATLKSQSKPLNFPPSPRTHSFLGASKEPVFFGKFKFHSLNNTSPRPGFRAIGEISTHEDFMRKPSFVFLRNSDSTNGNRCGGFCSRGYVSVAEAVSSTDVEDNVSSADEVQELLPEMRKQEEKEERFRGRKSRQAYAPYFDLLPADKMSVIAMHQLAAIVMTELYNAETFRCTILNPFFGLPNSAILFSFFELRTESVTVSVMKQIRIHNILEKTRKKKEKADDSKNGVEGESPSVMKEQENLRKKVTDLIKKQKLPAVRKIVKGKDDSKPWNADARAKVGSRLIELLLQTAYIQPPCDQLADSPSEPRPAFVHTSRTVSYENKKGAKKYGVIQCDPLVLKGLEKTARHMVIPYMPMLVPPLRWRRYLLKTW